MKLKKLLKVIPEHEFLMIKSGEVRWLQEHVIPKKVEEKYLDCKVNYILPCVSWKHDLVTLVDIDYDEEPAQ